MGNIPINPSSIANAAAYNVTGPATPINLCKAPIEGAKTIGMQFAFNVHASWQVNFNQLPANIMSQIASLYVDASESNFDVIIYFPDTGYKFVVESQGSRIIPIITGASTQLPDFYVTLDSSDTLTSDIVNIQALNTFIPEFSTNELQKVLTFGYGALFEPQPNFSQSSSFNVAFNNPSISGTLINATRWYITSIDIVGIFATNTGTNFVGNLALLDGVNNMSILNELYSAQVATNSYVAPQKLISLGGLQTISSGQGPLVFNLSNTTELSFWGIEFNLSGGILIP